jgi:hypothetical protein
VTGAIDSASGLDATKVIDAKAEVGVMAAVAAASIKMKMAFKRKKSAPRCRIVT